MFFLVYLIASIGSIIYSFVIFDKIYVSKKLSLIWKIVFTVAISLGKAVIDSQSKMTIDMSIIKFSYTFIALIVLNLIFYKPPGKIFIIYDAIYHITTGIVEMLSAFLLTWIIGVPIGNSHDDYRVFFACNIFYWIVMIAIAKSFVLIVSGKGINNIRTHEFLMFLILILGEIFMLQIFNDVITTSTVSYKILVVLVIFLAMDLYLAYLLRMISKTYQTQKELELVTQQSMLQLHAYNELNEKYAASRHVIHDVRKHISSLEGLITANKADEAVRYKDLLNKELNKLIPSFECDSPILTVVINNKIEAAEKMKVDFRVDAEFTKIDFISDLDITAMFSNMLDNAFEACQELPPEKRRVWLSITRRNYFVFIFLENSFSEVEEDKEKGFRSTKKQHQGIGLSNIKSACEKYCGSFNAHTENDMFITEVLIPIPDNEFNEIT